MSDTINFKEFFNNDVNSFTAKLEDLQKNDFIIRHSVIADTPVVLIYPQHIGVKWTKDNMIFRSSVWTAEGKPVSLGWKKFGNWGENPDLFIVPDTLKNSVVLEKMDGSLLIISKFKSELITRTRGTFDARTLTNGNEIDELIRKYPKVFNNELIDTEEYSILCEWTSPVNRIVLDYGPQPQLFLLGIVKHSDYTYLPQAQVDNFAKIWNIVRPETYEFKDIPSMINAIQALKGKEGVCVFHGKDQNISKVKSVEYLTKHAFKNDVNLESVIDMFLEYGRPDYKTFMHTLEQNFDFECAQMARGLVSQVIEANREVEKIIAHMKTFVAPLRMKPRKEAAGAIMSAYGNTNRSGYAFKLLDNKPLDNTMYKKMLFQVMKG